MHFRFAVKAARTIYAHVNSELHARPGRARHCSHPRRHANLHIASQLRKTAPPGGRNVFCSGTKVVHRRRWSSLRLRSNFSLNTGMTSFQGCRLCCTAWPASGISWQRAHSRQKTATSLGASSLVRAKTNTKIRPELGKARN